ncbi:alpha/beta fold hydrolase [Sphingomonas sp. 1P08PE]|uniref:alpha/beta fold hydrolase n=1 Tax=Sphingomonas sp. 1P08PE TaxID=554122 RepID=UPI00399F5BC6
MLTMIFAAAMAAAAGAVPARPHTVRNVVLVHGATMDGSSWRPVYDRLRARGFRVQVVQLPLTGLADDVAATRQVIERQDGPVVLVGHSYGGAVVSAAGTDPKVRSLVYVAAFQPDVGESIADLGARFPMVAHPVMVTSSAMIVAPEAFRADIAADLQVATTDFLADAQRPTAVAAFTTRASTAAWRDKPSWALVARQDRTVAPDLERFMYARSKARTVEVDASHLAQLSKPDAVVALIEEAADVQVAP